VRPGAPDDRQADVAAEHEVRAVGEVDDAHHAEDEREPAGEQEQEGPVRHAVEGLGDPEFCSHRPSRRRAFSDRMRAWSRADSVRPRTAISRGRAGPMSKQKSLPIITRSAPTTPTRYCSDPGARL